ncbi:MAG: sugar phosphate isomerase/epimerase family protein [Pirellulaceae bacterium]
MRTSRRSFLGMGAAAVTLPHARLDGGRPVADWTPRWLLASSLYGTLPLETVLAQAATCGAQAIDIWPKIHADHREQWDAMGDEAFSKMLARFNVSLGCITQFPPGPFGQDSECHVAKKHHCPLIVTGSPAQKGLEGQALKQAVTEFVDQLKPHLHVANECGVTIAIENHAQQLVSTWDAIRWLRDAAPTDNVGIAMAPYHLPQDPATLASWIQELGPFLKLFYAWQHGRGAMQALPKEQQLEQLPSRGPLDFRPIMQALAAMQFPGWIEIFMHPFPRGIPILESAELVTEEWMKQKKFLTELIA